MSHNHWSPFEMVNICLEIETTRDIARQILRHRSFSFQEFSQRYAKADLGFHVREARLQDVKNRQSSIELTPNDLILQEEFKQKQEEIIHLSQKTYEWAIDQGTGKSRFTRRKYIVEIIYEWVFKVLDTLFTNSDRD